VNNKKRRRDIFDRGRSSPYNPHKKKSVERKRKIPVTVCIAALCEEGSLVIGVADKEVTDSVIKYNLPRGKLFPIVKQKISMMIAGDVSLQTEIYQRLKRDVDSRLEQNADEDIPVKEIAYLYDRYMREIPGENSEEEVEIPDVAAIVAGFDSTGGHIWEIQSGAETPRCLDLPGCAAIGIGGEIAVLQLKRFQHTPDMPFTQALLLSYVAKRRVDEMMLGIGEHTTINVWGPVLPDKCGIGLEDELEELYKYIVKKEWEIMGDAANQLESFCRDF